MVIILDLGGVLMRHNMPECLARFERLLPTNRDKSGKEQMAQVLGLQSNAEGTLDSLVDKYEKGDISTDEFVGTILAHSREDATREEVVAAWNSMHGGIPEDRLQLIRRWADAGHHLYMLSNNNDLHWHHVFSCYDLSMFRHCYASHLLHLAKPDPRIYQTVDQAIRKQEECPGAQVFTGVAGVSPAVMSGCAGVPACLTAGDVPTVSRTVKCPGASRSIGAIKEMRSEVYPVYGSRTIKDQQDTPQPLETLGDNQPFYFVDDLEANRLPAEQLGWKTFASLDELAELVPMCQETCPDVSR